MTPNGLVTSEEASLLKKISAAELGNLGLNQIVYIRPRKLEKSVVWHIHAADGTEMARLTDHKTALAACIQHELEPLSVH